LDIYSNKTIAPFLGMNDHHLLDGLGEFLTEKQKAWVKMKLKSETLFLLKIMLDAHSHAHIHTPKTE